MWVRRPGAGVLAGAVKRASSLATSRLELEMDASLDTLVLAAYVFADSFAIPRSGPAGKVTDAEVIALGWHRRRWACHLTARSLGWLGSLCPGGFRIWP